MDDYYEYYDYTNSLGYIETGFHPYDFEAGLAELETVVDYPIDDM